MCGLEDNMIIRIQLITKFILLCFINVDAEIGFIFTPKDKAIIYGQDVFLDCAAVNLTTGGREGITIQWLHNGNIRDSKTSVFSNGTLWIPDVTENDRGNYTCVVLDASEAPILESAPALVFHAYVRMFEVSPTSVFALEDDTISFDCITGESAPPPEIFWERNGEPFYGGNQFNASYGGHNLNSLVRQYSMKLVLRAKPYLDGTFNCVARNPVLLIEVRSLKVLLTTAEFESAPYIMDELVIQNIITPIDQSLMIDCPITGKPEVTITWYQSDDLIERDPDFFVLQNGSLHSPKAKQKHEGTYFCEGINTLGLARSPNISVTISRLEPLFIEEPQDLYVVAGLPAMLRCNPPVSVPRATVVWYKDDKLLVPRTGRRSLRVVRTDTGSWDLVFEEIQKMDEGEYFCVAENQYAVPQSRASRIATVTVGGAPIFVQPPVGLTVQLGKLAKLSCFVQGDPFPEVFWYFENELLIVSETVSFRQSNQELWIGEMNKAREGTYTCTASNRYGSIETSVYIKVLVPPVIMVPVGHNIVSLGEAAILPCGIYSDPSPDVTWYKDSEPLLITGRFSQLTDGLFITSVEVGDAGTYVCRATNIAGTVESEGTLETQVLPNFTTEPQDQVVTIGRNVTLSCAATGFPKPTITWYYNESTLFPPETLLSLNRERLFLYNVDWKHVGEYTCHAENIEGIAISSAMVKLQIPPKVLQIDGVPLLYEGEDLLLTCQVSGIPFPNVEWQFNRQKMESSQDGRIRITDLTRLSVKFVTNQDEGIYSCAAYSQAGVSRRDVSVYVISRPSLPVLQTAITTSATSVKLTWTIQQVIPQTPVNNVVVYYRKKLEPETRLSRVEVSSSQLVHEVTGLDPATDYIFMVAAENDAGISDVSNILAARTYDAGPSEPRNIETLNIQSDQFTVSWEIPEVTNGMIRRYRIRFREVNSLEESLIILSSNGSANQQHIIKNLKPYTRYSFEIQAATMEGDQVLWGNISATVEVKTAESAPVGPPQEVKAQALTFDTVKVTWEAVSQSKQNGPIKRYYIKYWLLSNTTAQLGEIVSESLDFNVNITDLDPYTFYMIKVTSENDGGIGAESDPVLVQTLPTVPSAAPRNVTVFANSFSLTVTWEAPPMSTWNSDLTGYRLQYWDPIDDKNVSTLFVYGLDNVATISNLDPFTSYMLNVAAFTTQVQNGVGPNSDNITARTAEYKPGIVRELAFTATQMSIRLSWKPPTVTNGIITEYLVTYQLIGPATLPANQNSISQYARNISSDSIKMNEVFQGFDEIVTYENLYSIAELCDVISNNQSVANILNGTSSQSVRILQNLNVSASLSDWLIQSGNSTVIRVCNMLTVIASEMIQDDKDNLVPHPVYNITIAGRQTTITDLEPDHIYNISVTAATGGGYGEPVTVQTATLKTPPTPSPTQTQRQTTTTLPVTEPPFLSQPENQSDLNLPVIIGGGVSGFVLILIILLVMVCLFLRRYRGSADEKAHVIKQEGQEDNFFNNMYGELDRPKRYRQRSASTYVQPDLNLHRLFDPFKTELFTRLPATMASAAEDGTDSVEVYRNRVKYSSQNKLKNEEQDTASSSSFMTDSSKEVSAGRGHHGKESFLDMGNTSYSGIGSRPGAVKSNPAYFEDPYSSGHETMSVTMAFSSEDMLSQGESTLRRKNKMHSADAAAIARLRNSVVPPGMAESDTSSLIQNEVEIVYNERTAL